MVFPQLALHPTAFRPPLYPMLLAAVDRPTGSSLVAGRALSLVLGLGVVLLTMRFGRAVASRRAGLVAGLVVAVYPPLLANDTVLLTESVSLLLMLALLLAMHRRQVLVRRRALRPADPRPSVGPGRGGRRRGLGALAGGMAAGARVRRRRRSRRRAVGRAQLGAARLAGAGDLERVQPGRHVLPRRPGAGRRSSIRSSTRASSASDWPSSTRSAGSATSSASRSTRCASIPARCRRWWPATRPPSSSCGRAQPARPRSRTAATSPSAPGRCRSSTSSPSLGLVGVIRRWRDPTVLLLMLIAGYFTATSLAAGRPAAPAGAVRPHVLHRLRPARRRRTSADGGDRSVGADRRQQLREPLRVGDRRDVAGVEADRSAAAAGAARPSPPAVRPGWVDPAG